MQIFIALAYNLSAIMAIWRCHSKLLANIMVVMAFYLGKQSNRFFVPRKSVQWPISVCMRNSRKRRETESFCSIATRNTIKNEENDPNCTNIRTIPCAYFVLNVRTKPRSSTMQLLRCFSIAFVNVHM